MISVIIYSTIFKLIEMVSIEQANFLLFFFKLRENIFESPNVTDTTMEKSDEITNKNN